VIEFQRATAPLSGLVERVMEEPAIDEEERRYLRDVQDHALRAEEQAAAFRALLQNILSVNLTLETKTLNEVSLAQNEQVKRISAWAAILFAPTLIGTNYGMNFDHVPELHWRFGYPFALALMVVVSVTLYVVFKRRRWI
jgi:magnesium transporter